MGEPVSYYTGDYSKNILPYGSGSTRGMTQRHYEAIADELRKVYEAERTSSIKRFAVRRVAAALAKRFAAGNDRFRTETFMNAVTNAARDEVTA